MAMLSTRCTNLAEFPASMAGLTVVLCSSVEGSVFEPISWGVDAHKLPAPERPAWWEELPRRMRCSGLESMYHVLQHCFTNQGCEDSMAHRTDPSSEWCAASQWLWSWMGATHKDHWGTSKTGPCGHHGLTWWLRARPRSENIQVEARDGRGETLSSRHN